MGVGLEELARQVVSEYVRPLAMNDEIQEVDDFLAGYFDEDESTEPVGELTEQAELEFADPLDAQEGMEVPDKFPA